jgi:tartrate dehydratase beta subunit/fumarate hydratase class I family protein
VTKLSFPFSAEEIRALKAGDEVLLSGVGFAGRGTRELQTGGFRV